MKVVVVSGKGGVGKSTTSAAIALEYARRGELTLLVDGDKGGKAIVRTISPQGRIQLRRPYFKVDGRLYGASTSGGFSFSPLALGGSPEDREMRMGGVGRKKQFDRYLSQFPGDYGLVALNDMIANFFGVNANVEQTADFIAMMRLMFPKEGEEFENIILDLEPTRGFSRMLQNADKTVNTVRSMKRYGLAKLFVIAQTWPDIRRFLGSEYIANIEHYSARIEQATEALRKANYVLVCGPEQSKVDEMISDVQPVVDSFGGRTIAYVVNDFQRLDGREERSQQRQLERVLEAARDRGISMLTTPHNPLLTVDDATDEERQEALLAVGRGILGKVDLRDFSSEVYVPEFGRELLDTGDLEGMARRGLRGTGFIGRFFHRPGL